MSFVLSLFCVQGIFDIYEDLYIKAYNSGCLGVSMKHRLPLAASNKDKNNNLKGKLIVFTH